MEATEKILDGLGSEELHEDSVADLKWRFFSLGLQLGAALQMFFIVLVLVLLQASNEGALHQLSQLYYPLFRVLFLLSFFGMLFAIQLFVWKRTGIDYTALLGVCWTYHVSTRVHLPTETRGFAVDHTPERVGEYLLQEAHHAVRR